MVSVTLTNHQPRETTMANANRTNLQILSIAYAELSECLERLAAKAEQEQHERLSRARFEISDRMSTTAGKAHIGGRKLGLIKLSGSIMRNGENTEDGIRNTIRHEMAHIAAPYGAAHGPVWKAIARSFGCTAERCHTMACAKRKPRTTYIVACERCAERWNIQGRRTPTAVGRTHRNCGGLFVLKGTV